MAPVQFRKYLFSTHLHRPKSSIPRRLYPIDITCTSFHPPHLFLRSPRPSSLINALFSHFTPFMPSATATTKPFNSGTRSRLPIPLTVTSTISRPRQPPPPERHHHHHHLPAQKYPPSAPILDPFPDISSSTPVSNAPTSPSKPSSVMRRPASVRAFAVTFFSLLLSLFLLTNSSPESNQRAAPPSSSSPSSSSATTTTASARRESVQLPSVAHQVTTNPENSAPSHDNLPLVETPRHNFSGSPTFRGKAVDLSHVKPCTNAVIFTGARQGSTWFIDSIERCAYSMVDESGKRQFHPDVFRKTEIWKHFGEPQIDGTNLSVGDALRYVVEKNSIKVFPSVFWRRRRDIATMLTLRQRFGLTILVLRRDVDATWHSWLNARSSKEWRNDQSAREEEFGRGDGEDDEDGDDEGGDDDGGDGLSSIADGSADVDLDDDLFSPQFRQQTAQGRQQQEQQRYASHEAQQRNGNWTPSEYRRNYQQFLDSRRRYDKGVEQLLREYHVPYDVFDYEVARDMPAILARNNRCLIRNCNFGVEEQGDAIRKLGRWEASEYSTHGQDMLGEELEAIREGGAASDILHTVHTV